MSPLSFITSNLGAALAGYGSEEASSDSVALANLSLHIHARILDQQAHPGGTVLVVLYDTREEPRKTGMQVTCVGMGGDPDSAARNSVANFAGSVMPVLDVW